MTLPSLIGEVGHFAAVAVAYFLVSLIGVEFVVLPEQMSVFWPGGGLAVGYLLVIDRRRWPAVLAAVFTGNVAGNFVHGHTLAVSSGFAAVNTAEPLACVWLFTWLGRPRYRLDQTRDIGKLFLVPVVVCAVPALAGAGVVTVGLGAPYWSVWKVWWLADALGVILFAPLVVVWGERIRGERQCHRVIQCFILLAVLAALTWAIFASDLGQRYPLLALPYPVFPFLLFVALQSGLRGTTVAVAVTTILSAWGTIQGAGPVAGLTQSVGDRVLITQGFAAVVALSSLILATAIRERGEREVEILELNRTLTERVREAERASTALRESEKRFQAIFHSQFQFIGLMATDGTLLEANRTALSAAGVAEEDVIGKPFWETGWWTHDPAQQERLRQAVRTAAGGVRDRFEASHPTADGGLMWVDFSLTPFRDDCGRVTLLIPEGREISNLKRAEVRLRESEERFELAVRGSQDGIWDWHIQTGEAYFSPRWKGMLGYAEGELVDHFRTWERLIHPDDVPRATAALTAYFDGAAATYAVEIRMRHKEGGYRWIFTRGVAVRDGDGRPYRMAGSHTDITAWKAAEVTLRDSEERFRAAMEGSLHAVYFLEAERGPDGRIFDFRFAELNGRGAELIARPRENVIGRRLCELIPVNRTGGFFEKFVRVTETGEPLEEEFLIGQADGITASWLHHQVVRVGDGVVVTSQDVTARRTSEEALRASEERYRSVVDALAEGIVLQSESGEIVAFNERAKSILGLTSDRLGARTSQDPDWRAVRADGQPLPGDEHPSMVALRTGRPVFNVIMGVERPSRERVWLSVNAVPFGGSPRQVVASFHDVTERKTIETQLREANAVLQTLTQVQREFLVTASPQQSFDGLLSVLLRMTGSEYGFIGQVLRDPSGQPYLKTRAITDISWDDATRRFYAEGAPAGLEFRNRHTLFGEVLVSGRTVIANQPAADPRRGGLPPGHPPLNAFLGIPLYHGSELIGMVGVANRAGGYDERLVETLAPVLSTCASLLLAFQLQTERASAETALRASLSEKDVMLREIHHRVKNNLAVIASLFQLQSGYTADEPIRRLLMDAQDRVRSMALVHEHLYNSADLAAVHFGEYTRTLAEQLFRSYQLPGSTVTLTLDVSPLTLSIDQAVPCGLVLNELMSNGLKHAFPNRGGTLTVSLGANANTCLLRVSDDGVGIPTDRLEGKPRSLGLRLIRTLARQLTGLVEFSSTARGTDVRLTFPLRQKSPGVETP